MGVARNIAVDSRLVPGGGAIEMAVSHALQQNAAAMETVEALPYRSMAMALEVIPRTLIGNCGVHPPSHPSTSRCIFCPFMLLSHLFLVPSAQSKYEQDRERHVL